ncbi:aminoglycoside phosphotransferase family protein [Martelella endophytica]|uniref:Streptomycin kinase n=1 Tax=Martelella endophytica TaxID=1486262 RepID=A0A0D5LUQ2_MAREN|nr:aminoglycoside phosphotransferase family protein [Martelella endophytica]AJY47088.1 streptomycin kinase [Martelella endophytica]
MFEATLRDWHLTRDGSPIITATGSLLPVIADGAPAMLKHFTDPEEEAGAALLSWWDGDGATRILRRAGSTILMERATTGRSLVDMAVPGADDEACRVFCTVAGRLHRDRPAPAPALLPLRRYFRSLLDNVSEVPMLQRAAVEAERLLAEPADIRPLHGDLHHGNILDFGARGFLAIDPKGLVGERTFDFANLFCNPDIDVPEARLARDPQRLAARLALVADIAGLDPERLLRAVIAWCGLSAAWFIEDRNPLAEIPLTVGQVAIARLDRG